MIKVNVEIDNKSWKENIKNPNQYLSGKLNKISKIVPVFRKKKTNFHNFINQFIEYEKIK